MVERVRTLAMTWSMLGKATTVIQIITATTIISSTTENPDCESGRRVFLLKTAKITGASPNLRIGNFHQS